MAHEVAKMEMGMPVDKNKKMRLKTKRCSVCRIKPSRYNQIWRYEFTKSYGTRRMKLAMNRLRLFGEAFPNYDYTRGYMIRIKINNVNIFIVKLN